MKKLLQLALLWASAASLAFAGSSITVNGNTTFQVRYNAYEMDSNGSPQFPLVNALVNYTISDWFKGTDNGSSTPGDPGRSPFDKSTKYTKFKMTMDIHNTSTAQSWITSLGWVTDPDDARGYDSEVTGIWSQFNYEAPHEHWPQTFGKEWCISDYDDNCNSPTNSKDAVQNGKKSTVSAWVYFAGHSSFEFEQFWIRYSGMDYRVYNGNRWCDYEDAIGRGTIVPEPTTTAALAASLGLVALWARRRKKA